MGKRESGRGQWRSLVSEIGSLLGRGTSHLGSLLSATWKHRKITAIGNPEGNPPQNLAIQVPGFQTWDSSAMLFTSHLGSNTSYSSFWRLRQPRKTHGPHDFLLPSNLKCSGLHFKSKETRACHLSASTRTRGQFKRENLFLIKLFHQKPLQGMLSVWVPCLKACHTQWLNLQSFWPEKCSRSFPQNDTWNPF